MGNNVDEVIDEFSKIEMGLQAFCVSQKKRRKSMKSLLAVR